LEHRIGLKTGGSRDGALVAGGWPRTCRRDRKPTRGGWIADDESAVLDALHAPDTVWLGG